MKDLVESILNCSSSPENWEKALDIFTDTFQVSACAMYSVHEFLENRSGFFFSQYYRENELTEFVSQTLSGSDTDDLPAYQKLASNPPQKLYDEIFLFGSKGYEDLPKSNIRELIESWGFKLRVAAALNRNGPWMDGLFCQHRTDKEWKSFVANDNANMVLPIIANSLELGRTLQALRSRFQASLSVLDSLGLAVFLADETGSVIERNKEAQRILDSADGVSLTTQKRLKLHAADKTAELEAMVDAANGLLRGEFNTTHSMMACKRPSGAYDYLVSVRSLSDTKSELEKGFKCAFVTFVDPSREKSLSAEGITALGELSLAESEVVDLLVSGLRPADVAERRDVSLNTVKKQLQIVSQKLRCTSQSDIIRVAAATRLPIDE